MGCFPCRTLQPEVAHLKACYPPSKALLTAGPEYRPLSQDLSKLTYFATNKPSKLAKIGEELEKRVAQESTRASSGNHKYRASLLISLAILRALLTECKRDIALFARSTLRVIDNSLDVRVYQRGGIDLEVVGRAAAAFIAYTTYTDGSAVGVDDTLTKTYFEILYKFGNMATVNLLDSSEKPDMEQQNRTRLIALAGLNGAATSDTIFASTRDFSRQIDLIIPPLLVNIFEGQISELKLETAKIGMDASPSPYFSEFAAKGPIAQRKAPSLHAHIPGEKGPTSADVISAALRSLHSLLQQCNVTQASQIIDRLVRFLDKHGWQYTERDCFVAEQVTAWIPLQYRFIVPTRLVEVLMNLQDGPPTPKHISALAMVTTILNSTTSLVGLGVTDLLQNLVSLIIRRLHFDLHDILLPPLVRCVSSLGTHIYYADQINDIVEELALRIAEIPSSDTARSEIIRVLTCCISGVMIITDAADNDAESKQGNNVPQPTPSTPGTPTPPNKGKSPARVETPLFTPLSEHPRPLAHRSSRRNPISPEVWQETLPLLCEADYAVRSTYARALILFLETEMRRGPTPGTMPGKQSMQNREKEKGPSADMATYRFCHALNAAVYSLMMSSCLGMEDGDGIPTGVPTTAAASPEMHTASNTDPTTSVVTVKDSDSPVALAPDFGPAPASGGSGSESATPNREKGVSFKVTEPTPGEIATQTQFGSGAITPPKRNSRSHRPSLPLNRLQSYTHLSSFDNVATPLDFAVALRILDAIHMVVPVAALVTGTPMLLAVDRDAGNELVRRPGDGRAGAWVLERKKAIRELVSLVWRRIGDRWGIVEIDELANKALASLPEPYLIPPYPVPDSPPFFLSLPEEPVSFIQHTLEGESSSTAKPLLDQDTLLDALVKSKTVQAATQVDEAGLRRIFDGKWSVERAIKDSIERFSSANLRPDDDDSHYNAASALLMSMNNASYQSVNGQRLSRTIDVTDLRDALGGRVDTVSTSGAPSIASFDDSFHSQSAPRSSLQSRRMNKDSDVKEVLKDIFRDKKRGTKGPKGIVVNRVKSGSKNEVRTSTGDENGLGMSNMTQAGGATGHKVVMSPPLDLPLGRPVDVPSSS
ncbi:protein EFR3 [Cryptococcus neoformans Tu401-1]|nr:protein EFR3 [Cryptococcus neoformans var. grubii Tu401-1]